jgi:hypothetical protein
MSDHIDAARELPPKPRTDWSGRTEVDAKEVIEFYGTGERVRSMQDPIVQRKAEIQAAVAAERAEGDRRVAEIRQAAVAVTAFDVNRLCEKPGHRPLRFPLCRECQLAARIEELRDVLGRLRARPAGE